MSCYLSVQESSWWPCCWAGPTAGGHQTVPHTAQSSRPSRNTCKQTQHQSPRKFDQFSYVNVPLAVCWASHTHFGWIVTGGEACPHSADGSFLPLLLLSFHIWDHHSCLDINHLHTGVCTDTENVSTVYGCETKFLLQSLSSVIFMFCMDKRNHLSDHFHCDWTSQFSSKTTTGPVVHNGFNLYNQNIATLWHTVR